MPLDIEVFHKVLGFPRATFRVFIEKHMVSTITNEGNWLSVDIFVIKLLWIILFHSEKEPKYISF